ncbi:MAG: tRNA (adenosine(37)-N6)-threonylcarbamoyltransferase complex transferase subunit TsaD [Bacillota bacterium]|nr:tRNA (adenosine(37)-N6)-threonylcarbamoyltransferase complex transferase subunit TsaD [Bacillota bacterium]
MKTEEVNILGIETSCDETSTAVVTDGRLIRSSLVSSQVELHARFGGVVPEIASRHHLVLINTLIDEALKQAGLTFKDLDAVAVSHGPGLVGALLVGVATAKALAYALRLPLLAVNHLEAHLFANYLDGASRQFPAVVLIVSGGHTELLLLEEEGKITSLGRTRDDAAGEAYDKVARVLELGYPGGPLIDKLAMAGDPTAVEFPRAWLDEKSRFDFSFSGLKTAVINHRYHANRRGEEINIPDLVASFQEALVEVLVEKTVDAATEYKAKAVMLAGGVAANSRLRSRLSARLSESLPSAKLYYPPLELCTDNAAMIAAAAYPLYLNRNFAPLNLNAIPGLGIGQ